MTDRLDEIRRRWEAVNGEDWAESGPDGYESDDLIAGAPADVALLFAEIKTVRTTLERVQGERDEAREQSRQFRARLRDSADDVERARITAVQGWKDASGYDDLIAAYVDANQKRDAAIAERDEEIERLQSLCLSAAEEIAEHWDAHCDADGAGPCNLESRLRGVMGGGGAGEYSHLKVKLHVAELRQARAEKDRDELAGLLHRAVKYAKEDRAVTPGKTRLARVLDEARVVLGRAAPEPSLPAREAARQRRALGGPDAQALEGALTITERERDEARAALAEASGLVASLRTRELEATSHARGESRWETLVQAARIVRSADSQVDAAEEIERMLAVRPFLAPSCCDRARAEVLREAADTLGKGHMASARAIVVGMATRYEVPVEPNPSVPDGFSDNGPFYIRFTPDTYEAIRKSDGRRLSMTMDAWEAMWNGPPAELKVKPHVACRVWCEKHGTPCAPGCRCLVEIDLVVGAEPAKCSTCDGTGSPLGFPDEDCNDCWEERSR
jgi:hypothetical protein